MRVQAHNVLVKATTTAEWLEPAQLGFQELIDVLPQHIFVLAPDGTPLAANQALLDYHGCTLRDIQDEHYRTGAAPRAGNGGAPFRAAPPPS